jgi:hypothetical protein
MTKFACQYALLRFRPFAETGEFANVGIVLLAPEARFFGFRLLNRYGRITQFFKELDKKVYLNGRELFKEELERFAAQLRKLAQDGRKTVPDVRLAVDLFAELVRHREAILQFDERRVVLADDPKAKLEGSIRKLLIRAQVAENYRPEKLGDADFSVNFPFVRMTEGHADRVIKPLYLAQNDTTKIITHGGQWVDKIRRLRKRQALPESVMFPVTAPAFDTRAYRAFEEISEDLAAERVQIVTAVSDQQILEFAQAH